MVSVSVSKLEVMDLIFIDARVKINGTYYCEVLVTKKLLSVMFEICGEFSYLLARQHRAREKINFLERDICVHFIRPFATK